MIKIPKMKSNYIPVSSTNYIKKGLHWWKEDSDFQYPFVLINLDSIKTEETKEHNLNNSETFFLTDSGGFQVIRGNCNYNWETSLLKQIELGASKIFAFDTPPVKRKNEGQNVFISKTLEEVKATIEDNIDVAIKQSIYLKEKYPEELKKFCYIAQGTSLETIEYNIEVLERKIGMNNYTNVFPGGIAYSVKTEDILLYAMTAKHAKDHFISKGIYVHFLGMGSFNKMLVMIRNCISTFDSSNALRGITNWMVYNPVLNDRWFNLNKKNFIFDGNFCLCPTCLKHNYQDLLKEDDVATTGINFVKHNLWSMLKLNIFLDGLRKDIYTEQVKEIFRPNEKTLRALEFIDFADKNGLKIAYDKYQHYLKKDKSKQQTLF